MRRTKAQNKQLFGLLNRLDINSDQRARLALQFSGNRTEHTSELGIDECAQLIETLLKSQGNSSAIQNNFSQNPYLQTKRCKIIAQVYQMPEFLNFWSYTGKKSKVSKSKTKKFNAAGFNKFLQKHHKSPFKGCTLNSLNNEQLTKLIRIFDHWIEFYEKKYNSKSRIENRKYKDRS